MANGIESIAVCLLFSFLKPEHEERVRAIIVEEHPECSVSLSSEVLPQIREYYRLSTTVINAYLAPMLARYIANLDHRLTATGIGTPQKYVMQSNGGMSTFAAAARKAVTTVLSGPAGGVTAGVAAGRAGHTPNLVTFDMGGTSCDVALIRDGEPAIASRGKIEGRDIAVPMMDINTVSAGGGTIARVSSVGTLEVGPQSAARPGPACYGRGGEWPTITDCNLALGYLSVDNFLGGRMHLDVGAARRAIEEEGGRSARNVDRTSCRRDHPHHRREDAGGHQGDLDHARPRSARVHAARIRGRRTFARDPHRARTRNSRALSCRSIRACSRRSAC